MHEVFPHYVVEHNERATIIRLCSGDATNRLTRACILSLTDVISDLVRNPTPLIVTGNHRFFSAGADLHEIATLTGPGAYEFSKIGQQLMNTLQNFSAPVYAAVNGYCMGGGLDLALACHYRIASPNAIFGHRGAALGLITGWGGTQRLPRLIGRMRALEILLKAEKIHANDALRFGLIDGVVSDPISEIFRQIAHSQPRGIP